MILLQNAYLNDVLLLYHKNNRLIPQVYEFRLKD